MTGPPSGPDGIFLPIELDTSKAVEQLKSLKEAIQTDARPNNDLDNFFAGVTTNIDLATKATKKFQLNMGALAKDTAVFGHQFDKTVKSSSSMSTRDLSRKAYRPGGMDMAALANAGSENAATTAAKKAAEDERYRKMLGSLSVPAKFQMNMGELATSNSTQFKEDSARRERLAERQERYGKFAGRLSYLYGENKNAFDASGAIAGRAARMGTVAGAGLVASGFSGTTEGARFAKELRVLSLELAASFKPLMDSVTGLTRRTREWLQTLSPEGQDRLQSAGAAAAGAYVGYKIGGVKGAVVGAALGYGASEMAIQEAKDAQEKGKEFNRNKSMLSLTPQERLKAIAERKRQVSEDYWKEAGVVGGFDQTEIENRRINRNEVLREMEKNAKREIAIAEKKASGKPLSEAEQEIYDQSKSNPNRRQLMITEGVGFASAGSTWMAMQEELMRTDAAVNQNTERQLERIADGVEKLNK